MIHDRRAAASAVAALHGLEMKKGTAAQASAPFLLQGEATDWPALRRQSI
jgi:phage protein D